MVAVGFEPTKRYACDLKSHPFDHSGTLPDFPYGMSSIGTFSNW